MNSVRGELFSCLRPILAILFLLCSVTSVITQPPLLSTVGLQRTIEGFSRQDEQFLEDLQHRSFNYFWEQADPQTGLVPDRARVDGSALDENHRNVASIAATGFGLTALSIGAEYGWITKNQARERTRNTLRFFAGRAFEKHGWF